MSRLWKGQARPGTLLPHAGRLAIFVLLIAALGLEACGPASAGATFSSGAIVVSDVWARSTAPMSVIDGHGEAHPAGMPMAGMDMGDVNGAAYLTIRSHGPADRLLQAQGDIARSIEIHSVQNDNGVLKMNPLAGIDIPAGGELVLKPGAGHLMLIGLSRELKPGDSFEFKLQFAQAGEIDVRAEVRQR